MRKIISVMFCVFILLSVCAPVCFATGGDGVELELTIDVNKRYTNIQDIEDDPLLSQSSQKQKEKENKTTYIIILLLLLIVSVIILVVTLKKVPTEKEIEEKDTAEILGETDESNDK